MIIEAILELIVALFDALFSFLASVLPAAPAFWTELADAVNNVFGLIPAPVRYFVPIEPVIAAGLAMVALVAAIGLLKLARRLVSLFTGGGGMA